jgi:hypothetical protein
VRDISNWFEAKSTEHDSAGIRQHLDSLLAKLKAGVAAPRRGAASIGDVVATVPDSGHPRRARQLAMSTPEATKGARERTT